MASTAGPDHELADAAGGVEAAVRRHPSQTFVGMVVPAQDRLDTGRVEGFPEWLDPRLVLLAP